jgi:hypothetical protein
MPKASRRTRTISRSINSPKITTSVEQTTVNKPKAAAQTYNAFQYIKKDLTMSALTAGIVVVVLIILYIFLR